VRAARIRWLDDGDAHESDATAALYQTTRISRTNTCRIYATFDGIFFLENIVYCRENDRDRPGKESPTSRVIDTTINPRTRPRRTRAHEIAIARDLSIDLHPSVHLYIYFIYIYVYIHLRFYYYYLHTTRRRVPASPRTYYFYATTTYAPAIPIIDVRLRDQSSAYPVVNRVTHTHMYKL